jgi:hypothetical protein
MDLERSNWGRGWDQRRDGVGWKRIAQVGMVWIGNWWLWDDFKPSPGLARLRLAGCMIDSGSRLVLLRNAGWTQRRADNARVGGRVSRGLRLCYKATWLLTQESLCAMQR